MQLRNEQRDLVVLRLLKTVEKQGEDMTSMVHQMERRDQEMAKRDVILTDLVKTVKRQGEAIEKRDAFLTHILEEVTFLLPFPYRGL